MYLLNAYCVPGIVVRAVHDTVMNKGVCVYKNPILIEYGVIRNTDNM